MSTIEPYDVTVVGAGLAGALVASILAEEGLQVVVLEATEALGGTIRRQPGLAMLGTPEPFTQVAARRGDEMAHTLWELTSENLVRLEILLERLGLPAAKVGSLRLANDARQSAEFRDSVTRLREYGYAVTLEDDSRYGDQVAISTSDDLLFTPQALISKLLEHENIIVERDAEVEGIKRQPDGSIAVSAHKRYLWTRKVIFANGIHATRHDPNLAKILHPACVHTIVFENNDTLAHPLIMDSGRAIFIPHEDNAYLTGWSDTEADLLWRLSAVANQLCPDALTRQRFTSWVAAGGDQMPVIGSLSDQPDAYAINGLGPFGLNFALVAADELAELVLHDRQPTLFAMAQS